jgi:hypothetical protein
MMILYLGYTFIKYDWRIIREVVVLFAKGVLVWFALKRGKSLGQ